MTSIKKLLTKRRVFYAYLPVYSILLFIALEIQNSLSAIRSLPVFAVSFVLIFLTLLILFSLTDRIFLSGIILSVALLLLYIANFYRQMQTGQVLIPSDLNLARHLRSMAAFSVLPIKWQPVCSVLCVTALNVPLFFASSHIRIGIKKRAIIFSVSGLLVFLSFFSRFSKEVILSAFFENNAAEKSYNDIYETQGALLGFYSVGMTGSSVEEPAGYSREYMESYLEKVIGTADILAGEDGVKPNVIVVMSEAFWDPTRLPNVEYSEDPVPNLHKLQKTAASGNIISPTFGGMTCNVEFEFLTGNAMEFTGFGDIPYYDSEIYVDRDNGRSLPGMFKANGYRTVALHTFDPTFFNRDYAYPKLGFDVFISEDDMPDAPTKGSLSGRGIISDAAFCDKLIEVAEETEEPLFLFGVTMQNHMPYLPAKYESTRIKADSAGLLSDEDTEYLETYLEGVYDADEALERLCEYVAGCGKPTILLYFGDHLPTLARHTGIYTELGYIDESGQIDNSLEDAYKMYTTPYVALSNYAELPSTWGDASPYFLGALLADAAGIRMNYYYIFLSQAFGSFRALNGSLFITDGAVYGSPRGEDGFCEMLKAFQYDKLFGQGYVDGQLSSLARP